MSKERYVAAKQRLAGKQLARGCKPRAAPLPPGQKITAGFLEVRGYHGVSNPWKEERCV